MRDLINQEQILFTDEQVKSLIEQYIYLDGDFVKFYKNIYDSEPRNGKEGAELKLDMIPKTIAKYILDNVVEFIEYCNNRQVRIIEDIRQLFEKEVEFATMKSEKLPEDSEERKKYENEKNTYKENINLGQIGYGIHIVAVRELKMPLRTYMEDNWSKALPEMISNYRKVCQAHGISEENEEKTEENKEKTLVELQQELDRLKKQDMRTTQQRDEAKMLKNAYLLELNKK